jgi:hypothetical protein
LLARLATEPRISSISSYFDRATAENVIAQVLEGSQIAISIWLSGWSERFGVDYSMSEPVGIFLARGATGAVIVNSTRIILVRDPSMPTGYRILTGFPIKP